MIKGPDQGSVKESPSQSQKKKTVLIPIPKYFPRLLTRKAFFGKLSCFNKNKINDNNMLLSQK